MCSLMSVIAAKSDYIYSANTIYSNLRKNEETFAKEAYVLSYVKCALLRNEELDDFYINGISVAVSNISGGYNLRFSSYSMDIEVSDKQIIDFSVVQY